MKAKLALVGASVLVVLALAELALRKVYTSGMDAGTARVIRASQDPELVYEMAPLAEAERDGVAIRINADGFRDDPFPDARAPGELRIVLIGDSVAGGLGVAMEEAFPQLLEHLLGAAPPAGASSAVVLNMSVYGYSTRQELRLLETRGLGADPDLVILAYHLNDPDIADAGQLRHFSRPPLALIELGRDAWQLIRLWGDDRDYHTRIHEDGAEEIAADFRRLGAISQESGVPILVAVVPVFEWTSGYAWLGVHQQLRDLAEGNDLGFLDLRAPLTSEPQASVTFDFWHPNARGHRIIAEALAEWVRRNPPRRTPASASR